MKKTLLLAGAAILALSVGNVASAGGAHPALTNKGTHSFARQFVGHPPTGTILVDQNTDDSGIGVLSQNFEASFDAYDSTGADDFTVPSGEKWVVKQLAVTGVYFNGPGRAVSEHVVFYRDASGLPGAVVADMDGILGRDNKTGSFFIHLPTNVKLKPGTYWLSVQVNMDFATGGEWGWESSATQANGSPDVWENPGDAFATGCTTFTSETTCVPAGQGPNKLFTLYGSIH